MDSLFKRLILINGIGISLLIAFVYLNLVVPSDCSQTLNLFSDAYAADKKSAGGQSLPAPLERSQFNRRLDVYEFIVGVFLTSLGLIAIAFAVVAILAGIYLHKPWAAYMASNILAVVGLAVILVNLFWRGLSLTREIRILRVGFVVFAVFSLHANLAYYLFSGNFAQDLEPVGLQKAHLMMT